ncbi:MAG: hypothetical protein IKD86_01695 [Firmicutes bacterium]|nr:hypothetical protein [Bacillota bacterium]
MGSFLKDRHKQVLSLFLIVMCLLIARLFVLTVIEGKSWANDAESLSNKTVYTSAARGRIYDRYGRLVAGNEQIFAVDLIAAEIEKESINDVALNLINLLERNGDEYTDDFPIRITEDGSFYYTYDKETEEWLQKQNMSTDLTAKEAFAELRERENIDESLTDYEAQEKLQKDYGIYPPISVKKMVYTSRLELNTFLEGFHIDTGSSAGEAFVKMRNAYGIDENLSDEDARKILLVRNTIKDLGYQSYMPAEIASGISEQSVIELEENSDALPGVKVVRQSVRYYPNGSSACHILGYMGSISESEKEEYIKKGYSTTDLIGKEGIESFYESILKGSPGTETVQVNAQGEEVAKLDSTEPVPGKDVTLTVDMNLQKVTEDALKEAISEISRGGTFSSRYGNYGYSKSYSNCNAGAAVAVDVKTGEVLALASYPGYDPNLFSQGISEEDWDSLQSDNPRDPLSARPLYDIATMSAIQPGSTFKPITCLSALNKGFSPSQTLTCAGAVKLGSRTFGCWIWNDYHGAHGGLNMRNALAQSCNYYMYDLGAGRNFAAGTSLPVDHDISDVMDYAAELGMNEKTGLEISESISGVPSEERKANSLKSQLSYYVKVNAEKIFEEEISEDDDAVKSRIEKLTGWIDREMTGDEIKSELREMGVKSGQLDSFTAQLRDNYVNQGNWTTGDKLNLSIGQGENAYTPAQMARYVATVANGGTLYDLTLTRSIEGQELERNSGKTVENSNSEAWDVIQDGMHRVAQGGNGTARRVFAGFPYSVGAKTGTAQKSGKINTPDEVEYVKKHLSGIAPGLTFEEVEAEMDRLMKKDPETFSSEAAAVRRAIMNLSDADANDIDRYKSSYSNFSWFVAFGPTEDPQIAVAVLLFQGGAGSYSGPVAREIIGQYLDLQKQYESGDYSLLSEEGVSEEDKDTAASDPAEEADNPPEESEENASESDSPGSISSGDPDV